MAGLGGPADGAGIAIVVVRCGGWSGVGRDKRRGSGDPGRGRQGEWRQVKVKDQGQ